MQTITFMWKARGLASWHVHLIDGRSPDLFQTNPWAGAQVRIIEDHHQLTTTSFQKEAQSNLEMLAKRSRDKLALQTDALIRLPWPKELAMIAHWHIGTYILMLPRWRPFLVTPITLVTWPNLFFSGEGAFLPKWPLFLNWCEELFAACVVFFLLTFWPAKLPAVPSFGRNSLETLNLANLFLDLRKQGFLCRCNLFFARINYKLQVLN